MARIDGQARTLAVGQWQQLRGFVFKSILMLH